MSASPWIDCRPEHGIEAYSERSTERRQVFEDAASRLDLACLPPSVWAFLQVADLDSVKELTLMDVSWKMMISEGGWASRVKDALLLWKQRPVEKDTDDAVPAPKRTHSRAFSSNAPSLTQSQRSQIPASETRTRPGRPLGVPEGSVRRDVNIAERCKERDDNLCNKVDAWRAKIFNDNGTPHGTETVENMITLTATLHNFHTEAAFALRPLRITADKTQLELEIHWLKRQARDSRTMINISDEPMSSRALLGSERVHNEDRRPGQQDPGLLELQWHLQRIMAMTGAAGWNEDDFGDDDDSDPAEDFVQRWIDDTHVSGQDCSPSQEGTVDNVDGAYD
ncbi:hypothetical protein PMIN01_10694 [Paraphaeosphaeria minitans]|uniref:HNH nuclease domain-containing protein n=1 Tax=Paraphaeosphaeria minitans TaxID=565426 RepID=A0A9P6KM81_9PLEO|nr:hypothetical protein PMIN01_10694 [Paraphaeosphaeria minitans]